MSFFFGSHFKQCLPVVPYDNRCTIVAACIKANPLWKELGNETLPKIHIINNHLIEMPQQCNVNTIEELIEQTLGKVEPGQVSNKAIMTLLNNDCHFINNIVLDRVDGNYHTYYSRQC